MPDYTLAEMICNFIEVVGKSFIIRAIIATLLIRMIYLEAGIATASFATLSYLGYEMVAKTR